MTRRLIERLRGVFRVRFYLEPPVAFAILELSLILEPGRRRAHPGEQSLRLTVLEHQLKPPVIWGESRSLE